MHPQYIKLTAVRMTIPPQPDPRTGRVSGQAQMMVLQPPVERLLPLPQMFTKNQQDGRTEVETPGMVVTYRERFDDVVTAISLAAFNNSAIALVVDREMIDAAASAGVKRFPVVGTGTGFTPTVQEAVETAVNGVKAALESEGYVKNGAAVDEDPREPDGFPAPTGDATRDITRIADHLADQADENDPKWKDFVQTDGESVGSPAYSREPKAGDLRIHSLQPGKFFLEQLREYELHGEPQSGWAAPELPFSLMRTFDSRDELIEAVEKAGRGKLLVNA